MYILAIETTGPYGSVAIINEKREILSHHSTNDAMNHLTGLIPMVKTALEETKLKGSELYAIACDVGPGSFTGIRIGVSTARALAQSWGVKTVAVDGLESFLYKDYVGFEAETEEGYKDAVETRLSGQVEDELVCAIYNARRHQVYGFIDGYLMPGPYMIEDIIDKISENTEKILKSGKSKVRFFGDGIDAYEDIITERSLKTTLDLIYCKKEERYQDAVQIARLGIEKAERGETLNYLELLPNYMRQAEAEQKLKAGELPICKGPKQE